MQKIYNYFIKIIIFIVIFVPSHLIYNRKYLKSRYFKGRVLGIFSMGWSWVFADINSRIFLRKNNNVPFPISPNNDVANANNIYFHPDDLNNFQGTGKYFQAIGAKIVIGKGTWIANNVGIITTNHDLNNPAIHLEGKDVIIGEKCWIGMNAVILPGVVLGDNTIVGAGAIVTKSFPEGSCTIVGNPASVKCRINN